MMCKTVQEWNKCYIELIALYVHPKNSNHLRSHFRAIVALDHSRLGQAGKRIGPIFCLWQVYLTKSCQQIWWHANQPFILFIHHIWGETVLWGAVFIIQYLGQNAVFYNFARQIALIQYSGRSKHAWAFSKPFTKKVSKSPIMASRFSFLTSTKFAVQAVKCLNELQHNK